nr:MAG TPA: minor tail protein [Bacteriophage sp.]
MSEIDKLEIKIVADATEAEKSVKKLSESIEGIGKTGDSTKPIREIKSVLESIKTPEIEINGIKEFAKQARTIAHNFSKAAKSAKEIGIALKGVNLGQLTKKSKKESAPVEDYSHLKDIPIFDIGKQINGKPIQDAAKSMSDLTSETSSAVSVAGQLSAAMERVSENAAKTDRFSGIEKEISKNLGMTGVLDIDNGKFAETIEESKSLINGFRVDLEKLGLSEIKFPEIEKAEREFKNMENTVRVLTETIEELKAAGGNAKQMKPLEKQLERISQKSKIANLNLKDTIALARSKIPSIQDGLQEKQSKKTQQEGRRKRSNKSRGRSSGGLFGRSGGRNSFSLPKMVGMSVLYSTVFQLISTIQSAFTEGMQSLAQYSQSVNANISSMMSALMQLRNAFAAAFEPILSVVAPYLATFISWLARAINMLGQFIAALTGKGYAVQAKKVQMDYAKSLQKTAGGAGKAAKALKEMQDYTLGFDELHIIDKPSDSGSPDDGDSNDAGDLLPTDMFETVEIDSKIKGLADRIKEAFKTGDFYSLGADLGQKIQDALGSIDWDAIYEKADKFGTGLASFLNGLISPETFSVLGATIAGALNTALHFLDSFGTKFDWSNFGLSIATGINTFFSTFDFVLAADTANKWINGILTTLIKAVQGTDWTMIGEKIGTFIKEIDFVTILSNIGTLILEAISAALKAWNGFVDVAPIESTIIAAVALLKFTGLGASIAKAIAAQIAGSEIVTGIGTAIAGLGPKIAGFILSPWGLAIGAAILAVFMTIKHWDEIKEFLAKLWDGIKKTVVEVWDSIKNFFKTTWDEIVSYYPEKWGELKTATSELWESVKTTISEKWTAIKNFFTETIPQIVSDIVEWFSGLPGKIGEKISTLVSSILPTWGDSISTWISSSIPEKIKMIIDLFKGIPQGVYNAVTSMGRTIEKIGKWMWEGIKKGLLSLVPSGVKEVVSGILSGTKSAAEIHSPSKLFKREVGAYLGAGIVEGMEESVKGAGSVIDEIVDKVSGGGSLAPVVSVEAPDISQWDATWATLRENFAVLKEDIISSMNTFYSTISNMTTNFGTVSKAQITAYLLKVYDNIYNTFDAIRQTLQQVSDEVTRMLNQMVSDANSLAGLTGKKYDYVGGYTMQQAQRFDIEMFANGGFPRSGELFVAREAGAEMVGSIGGKAAVANNDQIERAIFNAVLTAMSQAMANGSSQPIELNQKIELDGDVIYNNQQRVSARRGINFGLGAFQR